MSEPTREPVLTLAIGEGPPEHFRRLEVPVHFTVCRIDGGLLWAAWGLN